MSAKSLFLLIPVLLVSAGCNDEQANMGAETDLSFKTVPYADSTLQGEPAEGLMQGVISGIRNKQLVVVTDEQAFVDLLAKHYAVNPDASFLFEAPQVDFNESMVVASFAGERNTAGYSTNITQVVETDSQVSVMVRMDKPGPTCLVAQVETQPYHFVVVERSEKSVQFVELVDGYSC